MKSYSPEDSMIAIVDSKSRTIFSSIAKGDNDKSETYARVHKKAILLKDRTDDEDRSYRKEQR